MYYIIMLTQIVFFAAVILVQYELTIYYTSIKSILPDS